MRCNTLILNLLWLRNGEEKRKKEEETTGQKYNGLPYTAAITKYTMDLATTSVSQPSRRNVDNEQVSLDTWAKFS